MLQTLFGRKGSSNNKPSAVQTAPQPSRPQFAVLTLGDLPKIDVPVQLQPSQPSAQEGLAVPSSEPNQPRSLALVDGPRRSVPDDAYREGSPDGLRSSAGSIYAASAISPSPITPGTKSSRLEHLWRRGGSKRRNDNLKTPISALETVDENGHNNVFIISEDDYEDDPFEDQRSNAASSVYVDRPSAEPKDPFTDGGPNSYATKSRLPRLNTSFLTPSVRSLSARSERSGYSNPFGDTPQQVRHEASFQREVSPVSAVEPVSQEIRYSDCGVNPFQGLEDSARKERESSGAVAGIWNMITNPTKGRQPKKTMSSPKIHIDTSALDRQSIPAGPSRQKSINRKSGPDSATSVSPAEWFSNLLVDYEGRPPEVNRAMSYIPTPMSAHPSGLSPSEITAHAVPYLANLEAELAELRSYKADKEAQERAQQERDRVRDLIQRQLANEQAIEALQQAIGGQQVTKEQIESPNIWTEIDLSAVRNRPVESDRRSMETVWPTFNENEAPPVPKIPVLNQQHIAKSTGKTFFSRLASVKRGKVETVPSPTRELKEFERPVIDTTVKTAKVLSVESIGASPNAGLNQANSSRRNTGITIEERYAPSSKQEEFDDEFPEEKVVEDLETEDKELGLPPPYTRGSKVPVKFLNRQNSRRDRIISEGSVPDNNRQRYPLRPSQLPKLTTRTEGNDRPAPRQLMRAVSLTEMQFTPTTPHHARSAEIFSEQRGPAYHIGLRDIGFGSNRPSDIRDAAERKRKRQEKRERRFRRGGWCWLSTLR